MYRPRSSAGARLAAALTVLALAACSSAPEQPILNQFFTASRLRDNTSLQAFATVSFDPRTQGTVSGFSITSVGAEQRRTLNLKALGKALDDVRAQDDAYMKRKSEYQSDNMEAIRRVLQAEREKAALKGKDAEVQAAWTKIREEGTQLSKRINEARGKLAAESALVELSVADPRNPVDLKKFDGELVTKEVTVSATVKSPAGESATKTLLVTMQRAELKGERDISGRWIVTGVRESGAPPGTKTS